jgi:tetratricopeptide (TPR) repeat protein
MGKVLLKTVFNCAGKIKMLFVLISVAFFFIECSSTQAVKGTPIEQAEVYFRQAEKTLKVDSNIHDVIAPLSKAVLLNPNHFGANKLLAILYMAKGSGDKDVQLKTEFLRISLVYFNKALLINGNDHEIYINRSRVFLEFGRKDLAVNDLEKVLEIEPNNSYARQLLNSLKAGEITNENNE